jgi:hypothetical protein
MSRRCDRCKRLLVFSREECKCKRFEVQSDPSPYNQEWTKPPDKGAWTEIYAADAEAAAEKFCERYDCDGEYTILKAQRGHVYVRDDGGTVTRWFIEAEAVPTYYAHEVK